MATTTTRLVSCMHADLDFDRAEEIIDNVIQRRKRETQKDSARSMKDEDPERQARS